MTPKFIRGTNSGHELPEERICELGDTAIEIWSLEIQRKKWNEEIETELQRNVGNFKCTNIHIRRVPEREEKNKSKTIIRKK